MYDELIEQIRNRASWLEFAIIKTPSKTDGNGDAILFRKAADAIADLITALTASNEVIAKSKPKWIPVTERLPEDRQRVLAISLPKIRPRSSYYRLVYFSNNLESVDNFDFKGERRCGFYYYDSEYGFCESDDVSHWMPLPEPPESDGE